MAALELQQESCVVMRHQVAPYRKVCRHLSWGVDYNFNTFRKLLIMYQLEKIEKIATEITVRDLEEEFLLKKRLTLCSLFLRTLLVRTWKWQLLYWNMSLEALQGLLSHHIQWMLLGLHYFILFCTISLCWWASPSWNCLLTVISPLRSHYLSSLPIH